MHAMHNIKKNLSAKGDFVQCKRVVVKWLILSIAHSHLKELNCKIKQIWLQFKEALWDVEWTREGQNMFELRISDSSSSIIFDQCKHRYSRSGCSQMSTNKNSYWTVLLAKILTTCKISLSFLILLSAIFFTAIVQSLVEFQKDHSTRPFP